jgi:hypothetical protein
MVGTASQHKDEGEQDQADYDDDLEGGEPKLEFSKEADAKVIDEDDQDQEYRDPDSRIDFVGGQPVLYNQRSGC